jgi:hypothetical protein
LEFAITLDGLEFEGCLLAFSLDYPLENYLCLTVAKIFHCFRWNFQIAASAEDFGSHLIETELPKSDITPYPFPPRTSLITTLPFEIDSRQYPKMTLFFLHLLLLCIPLWQVLAIHINKALILKEDVQRFLLFGRGKTI